MYRCFSHLSEAYSFHKYSSSVNWHKRLPEFTESGGVRDAPSNSSFILNCFLLHGYPLLKVHLSVKKDHRSLHACKQRPREVTAKDASLLPLCGTVCVF